MSKLTRLQTRLVAVQARIVEVEAAYPDIVKYKSYAKGFGEVQVSYQDFGAVADEYRSLCLWEDALEDQIAEYQDSANGGSAVARFRGVV